MLCITYMPFAISENKIAHKTLNLCFVENLRVGERRGVSVTSTRSWHELFLVYLEFCQHTVQISGLDTRTSCFTGISESDSMHEPGLCWLETHCNERVRSRALTRPPHNLRVSNSEQTVLLRSLIESYIALGFLSIFDSRYVTPDFRNPKTKWRFSRGLNPCLLTLLKQITAVKGLLLADFRVTLVSAWTTLWRLASLFCLLSKLRIYVECWAWGSSSEFDIRFAEKGRSQLPPCLSSPPFLQKVAKMLWQPIYI